MKNINIAIYNTVENDLVYENIFQYLKLISEKFNLFIIHENLNCKVRFNKNCKKYAFDKTRINDQYFFESYSIRKKDLNDFLSQNKIDIVNFFNGDFTVYKIKNIFYLLDSIKNTKIKFYWNTASFLKNRLCIYENLYLDNQLVTASYKTRLKSKINEKDRKFIDKYKIDYWDYKKKYSEVWKPKISKKSFKSKKFILHKIIKMFLKRDVNQFIDDESFDLKKPYILFLSSKNRHWFNIYANPKFTNPLKYLNTIEKSIPKNINLIIKPHPLDENIFKEIRLEKNSYLYNGKLKSILNDAELIISTGSTSGLEALTLNKKIIYLGKNSYLGNIDKDFSPITIVNNLNNLKNAILLCLKNKVQSDMQDKYLLSLLEHSYQWEYGTTILRKKGFVESNFTAIYEKVLRDFKK